MSRLEKAGAIIIGKTNLSAMSFDWQAKHPRYGTTVNPLNPNYSPGGSSGGSAAALAAGLVPFEIGSDIAGSLRVPAALCGVNTLRPTEGVVSLDGHMAMPMSQPLKNLITAGPMARSIDDLSMVFRAITDLPTPTSFSPLKRIAVQTNFPKATISSDVLSVINTAVEKIGRAGIEVVDMPSPIDYVEALRLWGHICGYELTQSSPLFFPRFMRPLYKQFFERRYGSHLFSTAIGEGMALSSSQYRKLLSRREELIHQFDDYLSSVDLLITPVSGIDGIPICKTGSDFQSDDSDVPYAEPFALYNCAFVCFAHPIVVTNVGTASNGMPVGIQLHGRRFADYQLMEFTKTIEYYLVD